MKFIFLMDPIESMDYKKDTTYVFIKEAILRGHEAYFCPKGGVSLIEGFVCFDVQLLAISNDAYEGQPLLKLLKPKFLKENEVDAVFVRFDPPFDEDYLMITWLLDQLPKDVFVMNSPDGIRTVNEKVWASKFDDIIPRTCITNNKEVFSRFLDQEKKIILKPTNGYGGQAVFKVDIKDSNRNVIFETVSKNGSKQIMLQSYIEAARVGDKRVLLLDSEPIGSVLRVHGADDHRNNFFSGGKPQKVDLTQKDLQIIQVLARELKSLGLYFVGIDIIGDYLIEVNVTSPTCVQEINRLNNTKLESQVIEFVEEQVNKLRYN